MVRARPAGIHDLKAEVPQRPGFEPWNLRGVTDADGLIVATAVIVSSGEADHREGCVARLATTNVAAG